MAGFMTLLVKPDRNRAATIAKKNKEMEIHIFEKD